MQIREHFMGFCATVEFVKIVLSVVTITEDGGKGLKTMPQ